MTGLAQPQNEQLKLYDPDGGRVWRAGTLVYTKRRLVMLFFWLLLGDFTVTLAMTALPMMLPLHLKNHAFTTSQIAWFMGMGNLAAMIVGPLTGMWSDRMRTRWGRRRPFVLLTAPIWGVGFMMIPFMESFWAMNLAVMLVSLAGAVGTVGVYLYNDVIPGELMGRFVGAFRFVGFGGAMVFQYLLFPLFDTRPTLVWVLCGAVGVVFNMAMLLMVREGEYPPPPPKTPLRDTILLFVREGLGNRFMWMLWLTLGMTALGGPAANYFILFFENDLKMSSSQIGFMMGTGTILAMVLAFPSGWMVDKLGANWVWGLFGGLVAIAHILMYFFIHDTTSCFVFSLIFNGVNMILAAALLPMLFSHLPREKFGQLASCQSLVIQGLLFTGNMLVGFLMTTLNDYRVAFLYGGIVYALTPIFLLLLLKSRNPFAHMETSMQQTAKTDPE
jgi:MFS family permease